MINKADIYNLIRRTTSTYVVIPVVFIEAFGSMETAIFLSRLMQWDNGAPVAVSMNEWKKATYLSRWHVENARKQLRELGIITEEIRKTGPAAPLVYISLDRDRLVDVMCDLLEIEPGLDNVQGDVSLGDTSKVARPTLSTSITNSLLSSSPSETSKVPAARETPLEPDPGTRIEESVVTAEGRPRVVLHKRRKVSANESMAAALLLAFRCPPMPSAKVKGRMRRLAKRVIENDYTEEMVKDTGDEWWHSWPGTNGSPPTNDQFLQRLEQHRIGAEKWRKA